MTKKKEEEYFVGPVCLSGKPYSSTYSGWFEDVHSAVEFYLKKGGRAVPRISKNAITDNAREPSDMIIAKKISYSITTEEKKGKILITLEPIIENIEGTQPYYLLAQCEYGYTEFYTFQYGSLSELLTKGVCNFIEDNFCRSLSMAKGLEIKISDAETKQRKKPDKK